MLWKSKKIARTDVPLRLKRKVFSQCIMTYGSETWNITLELEMNLTDAQKGWKEIC